jgi:carboxylate-amine ligase
MAPWVLNSRGATARFDRGSIEIRLLDAQECPGADLAVQELVVASLRRMIEEEWSGVASQREAEVERLAPLLFEMIRRGEDALIGDARFLTHFGCRGSRRRAGAVWEHLASQVEGELSDGARTAIGWILDRGTLSTRMLRHVSAEPDRGELREMCRRLAASLATNRMLE